MLKLMGRVLTWVADMALPKLPNRGSTNCLVLLGSNSVKFWRRGEIKDHISGGGVELCELYLPVGGGVMF